MNDENNTGMIPSSGNQITRTETIFYDAPKFSVEKDMVASVTSKPLTQEETLYFLAPTSMSSNDDEMACTSSDVSTSTATQHFKTSAGDRSGTKGFQFQFNPTLPSGEVVTNTIEDSSHTPTSYSGVETENPWLESPDILGMDMRNNGSQSQSKKRPSQDTIIDVGLSMIYSLSNLTDYIVETEETKNTG